MTIQEVFALGAAMYFLGAISGMVFRQRPRRRDNN